MYGFGLSTKIQLSAMHYPSQRLSKFGQIEKETVGGPFPQMHIKVMYRHSLIVVQTIFTISVLYKILISFLTVYTHVK